MRDGEHSEAALMKRPVGTVMTALIGLIVAGFSFLIFVLDLMVTTEIGISDLIVSFVVCGVGLTTGFFLLRSLVPRREPMSLFGGSDDVPVRSTMPTALRTQRNECPPEVITNARPVHSNAQITPVMKSHVSKSIATYKTHDSAGALGLLTAIGVSLVLGGRLDGGWHFLSLAVPAGGAVALVLYWIRSRQDASISAYKIPVAGGIIGSAALAGVSLVMIRFHFLRDFLGLAILAGGAIALGLNWSRRRRENSSSSFV
ncbi:MAG TPA: hypothetical protein VGK36_14695 [Candidatus Angelobacter sp.]|jgi:hypothetical protein